MMGWKLIDKPRTQRATKVLVNRFVEMDGCPHDRPLSERRLQVYQRLLQQGQFRPVTWATATCKETGGIYRVNGKHTSILLSGLDKLPEFYIIVEDYECDTLEDVAKLYATFDSNMQSRKASDIYMSFAATVDQLKDMSSQVIGLCATGVAFSKYGQDVYGRTQATERAELLLEHTEFVVWCNDLLSGGPTSRSSQSRSGKRSYHLRRMPVVAAMFATWIKAIGASTEFWTAVRDETGTSPNLPDRKLARYLMLTGVNNGGGARRVKTSGNREFYIKSLHAWNAWRKGETTNLNYYADKPVPTVS